MKIKNNSRIIKLRMILKAGYLRDMILRKKPNILLIESTNHCNYDCIMCPRTNMKRKEGSMDFNLYKKLIDDSVKFGIKSISLQGYGEPLLHNKLIDMIYYAKEKGISDVRFDTNAFLLNDKLSEDIIKSGLDVILFSVHGLDRESYRKVHGVDAFDKCVNNIRKFMEIRNKLKEEKPKIIIQTTRSIYSKDSIGKASELFKNIADELSYSECNWCSGFCKENISLVKSIPRTVPCSSLHKMLFIHWDGGVSACCDDFDGMMNVGNIKDTNLDSLWNNKKMKKFKMMHLLGKYKDMPFCRNCMDQVAERQIKESTEK